MSYKVLIGHQKIKDGQHTDWTVLKKKATMEEAVALRAAAEQAIYSKGWRLDHNNFDDTTSWYLKTDDMGQVIITIKDNEDE